MYRTHAFPLTPQDEHGSTHTTVRILFTKVDFQNVRDKTGFRSIFHTTWSLNRGLFLLICCLSACVLYWVMAVYHFNDVCPQLEPGVSAHHLLLH